MLHILLQALEEAICLVIIMGVVCFEFYDYILCIVLCLAFTTMEETPNPEASSFRNMSRLRDRSLNTDRGVMEEKLNFYTTFS